MAYSDFIDGTFELEIIRLIGSGPSNTDRYSAKITKIISQPETLKENYTLAAVGDTVSVRFNKISGVLPEKYESRKAIFDGQDNDIQNNPETHSVRQNRTGKTSTYKNPFNESQLDIPQYVRSRMTKLINECIDLLKENHNLILTGAPGTGKTFLAKQIALQMINVNNEKELEKSGRFAIVQFHPSYDYTDFVEGLRPVRTDEDGQIGFELKDGIFKEFCKNALIKKTSNFNEIYDQFVDDIMQNPVKFETPVMKKSFSIEINSNKNCYAIPNTEKATKMPITRAVLREYVENGNIIDWKPYTTAIGDYIKQNYEIDTSNISSDDRPFIFIIDEINRGEISKIFGELFFSIDPGYRGIKGAVRTQYANMNDSDEKFYVPENVYIIGTMNDIDRSVESFDFAMRRRFIWKDISAEQSAENMNLPDTIKNKMLNLNKEISNIEGLNASYHIGGAYFLDKEGNPRTDYDTIWNLRLEPLLREYLRGMPETEAKIKNLKKAFSDIVPPDNQK